jgi:hypothetical protein
MRKRLTETKFQNWRAIAKRIQGEEHLICLGHSFDQVKQSYIDAYLNVLTEEEQSDVVIIEIQHWNGIADSGKWNKQDILRIPNKELAK